ncbi:MAG: hypothetical protein ACI835_004185 [Planctomycetota bacterium]|jgi:hypothetical protein
MSIRQRWLASALSVFVAGQALGVQVHYNNGYPWSQSASSGPDAAVGGWWYNLGITGMRVKLMPIAPKHLLVRYVFPGSPADGVVQVGDVLTGAGGLAFVEDHQNGYGVDVFGAQGPIGEFSVALEAAQSPSAGGMLDVTLDRAGTIHNVVLPIGTTYGSFTATYPFNCPKSAQIRTELLDYLVSTQGSNGSWGVAPQNTFAPLALLTSNVPAHIAAAEANVQFHADTTRGDFTELNGLDNWRYMAAGIVMAEYFLQTGDANILPELQEVHDFIARSQYQDRSQVNPRVQLSHPGSYPTAPEEQHGGWGHNPGFEGYGPIAMTTGQGALVFALMDRCGITIRRSRLDAAYKYLQRGTGTNGYLWYLDEVASNNSWADVGRTGASAVANFLSPFSDSHYHVDAMRHTTMMGIHPESFPDTHGSPMMGMGYAAAALAFDLPNLRRMMDANRFWFALSQCTDGSYYYQPNRDNAGFGGDSRIIASAITAFIFSIPLQNLVVTGRP